MGMANVNGRLVIRLTDDPPENSCRPAVDYLFRSAFETAPLKKNARPHFDWHGPRRAWAATEPKAARYSKIAVGVSSSSIPKGVLSMACPNR